jgi:hypothetical protein
LFDIDTGFYVLFFVLGAIFGSFGNVIIYRLPREESIVKPRSHCYSCKTPVERSVSPMFGGRGEVSLDNGKVVEEEKVGQGIPHENFN